MSKKSSPQRAFFRWLSAWLSLCVLYVALAGGINCKCPPPEPDGEIADIDASEPGKDCYCVAPGTPCTTDGDCRSHIKYCIFLVCRQGTCEEPRETPPAEPVPEAKPTEPPPSCPTTCNTDNDCNPALCGDFRFCKDNRCQDSGIVRP